VQGEAVADFSDITYAVQSNLGSMLTMELDRAGKPVTVQLQPREIHDKDAQGKDVSFVGLGMRSSGESTIRHLSIGESFVSANADVYKATVGTLKGLWQMVAGERSSEEVGGVLRIAKMSGDVAQYGLISFIAFAAALSVNLGLINLFPVPLLDGGHLAYYAIEAVRGRPLGERAQEFGLKVGLALVLSLMLFATWNDLVYLKVVDFVKSLFT
jgi:regulator of sigma E protease